MADMLGTSVSGLLAFQRSLATTSHNISNVNTEGYSRQRAELETRLATPRGDGFIGNGVQTDTVRRLFDQQREDALRNAGSDFQEMDTLATYAGRIDNLLADKEAGLAPAMQSFFDSIQDVANDPSSSSAREVALAEADNMVSRFELLDQRFRDLDSEVSSQLRGEIKEINQYAESIAELNQEIREAEGRTGQPPNDLLDQRDLQIRKLSEKIGTQTVRQDDGAINVFVGNGQPLVSGDRAGELAMQPSEYDPGRSEITFTGGSGNQQTITGTISGGSIGGMLDFRSEILDPARNDLGRLATEFAGAFNAQHELGLDANGNQGSAFFATGQPRVLASDFNSGAISGSPDVAIADNAGGQLTGADYRMTFDGGAGEWQVENIDSGATQTIAAGNTATFEGLEIDTAPISGAQDGDSFLLQPTREAVSGMDVLPGSGDRIAAAGPIAAGEVTGSGGEAINSGSGTIGGVEVSSDANVPFANDVTLEYREAENGFVIQDDAGNVLEDGGGNPVVLGYDPQTDSGGVAFSGADLDAQGADYSTTNFPDNPLEGVSFTLAGEPDDGDAFVMEANADAIGDNRNAQELAGIADEGLLNNGNDSPQDFFSGMVGEIGTETRRAQSGRDAQEQLLDQARADREAVSGVNLEEEAANLLRFQQGFQAAARATTVANEVFQSLLSAVQR
ncbi:flagellar hook-associated protein FlgK [Aquisalimonas lutea]|uniref:flagellar hook-associated protein FlgK n=1 Tax=Aquisalimonas lutea TaxID=1327750 RepID=UPI0025B44778|nr:flagellar hook-associated protein FlgK [Aquisalimonas lutea]MDN3517990.1 flagellar hook-associated protein FlgK [Aquisalimonas lutea]